MKFFGFIYIFTVFSICAFAQKSAIKSARTEIAVDGVNIVSIKDIPTGMEFVQSPLPIFSLSEGSAGTKLSVAPNDKVAVKKVSNNRIEISVDKIGNRDISAVCTLSADDTNAGILAQISINNQTDKIIREVTFPSIAQKSSICENPDDDLAVIPICDGILLRNPTSCPPNISAYPGGLSMQFFARYTKQAGIFVAALDPNAMAKNLALIPQKNVYRTSFINKTGFKKSSWESCRFQIETFNGDWQDAAELYRNWAQKQKWCAKTFKERVAYGDVPQWLSEPSFFYTRTIEENDLPVIEKHCAQFGKMLGCPVTAMIMSWEKHGAWITPDYFPPTGGEKQFRRTVENLHNKNHKALLFLSGLNWTIVNKKTAKEGRYDRSELFEKDAVKGATCDIKSNPIKKRGHQDMGYYATICPTTPQAISTLFAPLKKCVDYGIDCVQADQLVGGGFGDCNSASHKHPQFGGDWQACAIYDLFKKCRDYGKSKSGDFAMSVEEPGEYFIPVLDTYHARDYLQTRWPRSAKNAYGVPLFTYVYHEYINGYGGDSCSANENAAGLYMAAMNLVCGKMPAVAIWRNAKFSPEKIGAKLLNILRENVRLMKEYPEFFIYGRMQKSPEMNFPLIRKAFVNAENKSSVDVPSVISARWQSPDGKMLDVYVCIGQSAEFMRNGKMVKMNCAEVKTFAVKN